MNRYGVPQIQRRAGLRRAFTLVEMLTVIVIIGILAALISGATIYARARAREAAIYAQVKQLEAALMEYKNEFGEFPPDFAGPNRVLDIERHIRRRWPRFQIDPSPSVSSSPTPLYDTLKLRLGAYNIDLDSLGPESALVFWLGGLPELPLDNNGQPRPLNAGEVYKPAGFHADESNPIQPGNPRVGVLFDFNAKNVNWGSGAIMYEPDKLAAEHPTPVVYFRAYRNRDGTRSYLGKWRQLPDDTNVCIAYMAENNEVWRNLDTFQLIHPGLDGEFGGNRPTDKDGNLQYPVTVTGQNFTQGDYDNITNFAPKLESEIQ